VYSNNESSKVLEKGFPFPSGGMIFDLKKVFLTANFRKSLPLLHAHFGPEMSNLRLQFEEHPVRQTQKFIDDLDKSKLTVTERLGLIKNLEQDAVIRKVIANYRFPGGRDHLPDLLERLADMDEQEFLELRLVVGDILTLEPFIDISRPVPSHQLSILFKKYGSDSYFYTYNRLNGPEEFQLTGFMVMVDLFRHRPKVKDALNLLRSFVLAQGPEFKDSLAYKFEISDRSQVVEALGRIGIETIKSLLFEGVLKQESN
jgi:hypothetical protein